MHSPDQCFRRYERRLLALLCSVLALLQILDLHSSLRAGSAGRTEANRTILLVIGQIGFVPALIAFKVAALGLIAGYYLVVSTFDRMLWQSISLMPVCAAYIAVVVNNYS